MSLSSLHVLADKRNELLLAEVAALLHDVGKCTSEFGYKVEARSVKQNQADFDPYKAIYTPQELRRYQFSPQRVQERLDEANLQYALQKLLTAKTLQALDSQFTVAGENYTFREAIYFSRPRFAGNIKTPLTRAAEPLDLLAYCHGEGHIEKEDPKPSITPVTVARHSAFGFPIQNLPQPNIENNLTQRLNGLDWRAVVQGNRFALRDLFSEALGDTRFPINDVTLWDWSYAVASLYKAELARSLLTNEWRKRSALRWRLLRVNFDVLGLYAKAVKIADLLGYQRVVEEACGQVKQLVEEEYPLGNEIYRDTSGIYFTFPDLDLPADLAQEIRRRVEEVEPELAPRIAVTVRDGATATEQLKGILAKARTEAWQVLAQPFDNHNLSTCWQQQWERVGEGKWEVCPVCHLRPMREGRETCEHCAERRGSRIEEWEKNPHRTIWIDELADHNDRVALLVGKFGLDDWLTGDLVQTMLVRAEPNNPSACTPKNPSPARLRRVWETCARFWSETVEQEILAKHEYGQGTDKAQLRCVRWVLIPDKKNGWKANVPYDGTVNGRPISLLWREDAKYFVTIINLQLTSELKQGQTITVSDPDEPRKQIAFKVQGVMQAMDGMGEYAPFLPLLSSPDRFLALVSAADALEIASKIREEYQKQFGKVQNRLPLFLGIVFFPRKMPLLAVMDTGRRMLDVQLDDEQWTVECCRKDANGLNDYVRFSKAEQRISWNIPTKMGDGTTDDVWYPYIFVERFADGSPDNRRYRFQHNSRWLVHVKDLKEDDVVSITPSRFAYLWLEHTAKRFEFDVQEDVLLLDELPRLMEMWKKICKTPEMTDTKMRGVQALLETKGEAWGKTSKEFQDLAQATLKRAGMLDAVTPEDVISGRFARCLELHTKILKLRLKKEAQNERQPETTAA